MSQLSGKQFDEGGPGRRQSRRRGGEFFDDGASVLHRLCALLEAIETTFDELRLAVVGPACLHHLVNILKVGQQLPLLRYGIGQCRDGLAQGRQRNVDGLPNGWGMINDVVAGLLGVVTG